MTSTESLKSVAEYTCLLAEWDWVENTKAGILPEQITCGSTRKVYWKCQYGHKWQATPNNRSRGQGCPVCAGRKVLSGYNDLSTKIPSVAAEWHPTKNESLSPQQLTSHSNRRVWWKCQQCGNEWITSVANRAAGKGCPICAREKAGRARVQKLIARWGSFAECHPDLAQEWNYEKNDESPYDFSNNSTKTVWWKCVVCGHSWRTTIDHRTKRGSGCPACKNKTVTAHNSLKTTRPDILEKWNHSKNTITPDDVTAGSNKKVWWICDKKHEWKATVAAIANGANCPVCCGQRVESGYNDLESIHPNLAVEWHPVKNAPLLPTQVTAGSSKRVWWLCSRGHEYQSTVNNRVRGSACPICLKEQKTSFPEQAIFFYLSQITRAENRYLLNRKTEIDVFLPEFRVGIEYDGYYYHMGEVAAAKEERKNLIIGEAGIRLLRVKEVENLEQYRDSEDTIYCRHAGNYSYLPDVLLKLLERLPFAGAEDFVKAIDIDRDSSAIFSQYIQSQKENSLDSKSPDIAAEWHPTRNGYVTPEMVSYASGKTVWWLGKCGHEWRMGVGNRNHGSGCPYCAGKQVLAGFNDIATTDPKLLEEWDYEKNATLLPQSVTHGSDKKVWWKCSKGHSYSASVANRYYGKGCPYCANLKVLKGFNDLKSQHPDISDEWDDVRNTYAPDEVTPGSNRKVWWNCKKCGHNWQCVVAHRVYRNSGCPACSGRVATEDNNLMVSNPVLCKDWNYSRNHLKPTDFRSMSNKKVWWTCSVCAYEWEATISDRSMGTGCPRCAGKIVVEGINDLATQNPKLIQEWNFVRNGNLRPETISVGTHMKVWWKCSACSYEWAASVANRTKGRGCPKCAREKTSQSKEKEIFQYDLYGKFVKKFDSIKAATEETGIANIHPSSGKKQTFGGFIWLLQKNDSLALKISGQINKNRLIMAKLPVAQYSLDGLFITQYSSSAEAEKANHISRSKVGECCRGKRKTAGGYLWRYIEHEE